MKTEFVIMRRKAGNGFRELSPSRDVRRRGASPPLCLPFDSLQFSNLDAKVDSSSYTSDHRRRSLRKNTRARISYFCLTKRERYCSSSTPSLF